MNRVENLPSGPTYYELTETVYRCRSCGNTFACRTSQDNLLVKFVDEGNRLESWMPTYENGGYLELLEKLVPGFHRSQQITMAVFRRFESEFEKYQHRPTPSSYWQVACGCRCTRCGGSSLEFLSETLLASPEIDWVTYDPI
jgi:hypothetical protein